MRRRETIVYVGPFAFPDGGAAARRILGNAKSLRAGGYEVVIGSGQLAAGGRACAVEGIEVVSLNERTAEHLPRFLKHIAYFGMGQKTVAWLDSLPEKPYAVVLYSGYSPYLLRLIPWAKRSGVRLIFDAVEWYDPASILGWGSPYQLNIELAMRWLLPIAGNVIAISEYLLQYYVRQGCHTVKVPPTMDVGGTVARIGGYSAGRTLRLAYAGSPGRKDLLDNILEAVLRIRASGHRVRLSVAGVSAAEAMQFRAVQGRPRREVSESIEFCGLLSHDAAMSLVRDADFSVLLRNEARYSRAGFPTKFAESMAVGTPMIGNLTSDLGRYMRDAVTGFVCSGPDVGSLEAALARAIALTPEGYAAMRTSCRSLAERAFDCHGFSAQLCNFLLAAKV